MLQKTAKVDSGPERDKCIILLIDEMYIKEDLVYNKHSGEMVGFTNLGSINDHLADFERSLTRGHESNLSLAKTMVVFMVRGLFTSLQFPYVHFACTNLCRDQKYDPLWEAIWRIENCGLKMMPYLFSMPDVQSFLSQRLCQDPLERFFDLQRQRGGVHENSNAVEFAKNTQALRVMKSVDMSSSFGNCRCGPIKQASMDELCEPLPKRRRTSGKRSDLATSSYPTFSALQQSEFETPTLVIMGSTLYRAMHALIEEDTKILNTSASVAVYAMAESVCRWLITHPKETTSMEKKIDSMLQKCMPKICAPYIEEKCKKKKIELLNCIGDIMESHDSVQSDSNNWIKLVDRGGLTFVNNQTFELFLAMEREVRSHLQDPGKPVNFMSDIAPKVKNNEDVLFCWSGLSSSWDEESSKTLFKMVVDLWLTICGYSNASAWIEKYKVSQMKSNQKSNSIRKQL
ncbi:hypothetical protein EMCRGX_G009790 [Ephydatia muelleri]